MGGGFAFVRRAATGGPAPHVAWHHPSPDGSFCVQTHGNAWAVGQGSPDGAEGLLIGRLKRFLGEFWFLLGKDRSGLIRVLMLIALSAFLDFLGVALVGPLLLLVSGPSGSMPLELRASGSGLALIGAVMVVVVCLRGLAGYRVQKEISAFSDHHRADLMNRLLVAYLRKPLQFHVSRGGTALLNVVLWHTAIFSVWTLSSALKAITDGVVLVALAVLLARTNPAAVAILAGLLGVTFWLVHTVVRPRLTAANAESAAQNAVVMASVTQSLSGIREIRVLGREVYFEGRLEIAAGRLADANARTAALGVVPRFAVEAALVLFLIAVVVAVMGSGVGTAGLTATLGVFGAAAVRLIPASTSLLASLNSFRASRPFVAQLAEEIREAESPTLRRIEGPATSEDTVRDIELRDVVFRYSGGSEPVLSGVSLRIERGQCVGLMGRSGAGKSTLADVLLGFLQPESGTVLVNGRELRSSPETWASRAAYIPQAPLLLDDTLRRNIALEEAASPEAEARMWRALEAAQLADLARALPQGLDTQIGDRGARLSGGQRQRVALARALYFDRQFIVLDEATSALDEETEDQIVRTLLGLRGEKTILVIAHRRSTLAACTKVYKLERAPAGSTLVLQGDHLRLSASDGELG